MRINPLHECDFYKTGHYRQYPEGTTTVFCNFTPRASRLNWMEKVVFFGLQYFVKEYVIRHWNEGFFGREKNEVLEQYRQRLTSSLDMPGLDVGHISKLHDLGYLPIKIMALPEGSRIPFKVAPLVMWNTHPDFYWLPNYLETILSATLWQPCTSATIADAFKTEFLRAAKETGGSTDFVQYQGHDFSFRGMSSLESAVLSGAGHLLSFSGTDTVPAIDFLEEYYRGSENPNPIGVSVPATEHSVMCMGGELSEKETYERLLDLYPTGVISIVSDTWDYWAVLTQILPQLKDKIMSRNGKLVIRPDSGNPVRIICGYSKDELMQDSYGVILNTDGKLWLRGEAAKEAAKEGRPSYITEEEFKGSIQLLYELFGGTKNDKGYIELDPHIGLIYGDSITIERAKLINERLAAKGFASTNWVAGIGSYSYQYNTRDTQGWAMKATYGEVREWTTPCIDKACQEAEGLGYNEDEFDICKDGCVQSEPKIVGREIFKNPKTDSGVKKSARGLIAVYKTFEGGTVNYKQRERVPWSEVHVCSYEPVFEDGQLKRDESLEQIRETLKQHQ